jgi:hypothetical protein
MPTHNRVRVHDDQSGAPIPPRLGEQHPKQSISVAELGTPRGALEHGQLLTEREILERDGSVSTADQRERSKRDFERKQHELSCPAISDRINRGRRSDSGERQLRHLRRHANQLKKCARGSTSYGSAHCACAQRTHSLRRAKRRRGDRTRATCAQARTFMQAIAGT